MGEILIGTSSWADRLLLSSGWYPPAANTPQARLAYYAQQFPLVEIDTSYYAIPIPETTSAWAAYTPDGFVFDIKAFSLLTGHPTPASALPADLRPPVAGDYQLRRRDLELVVYDELWARFHAALEPMAAKGKLGTVLLQFPPWLSCSEKSRERITDTVLRCGQLHASVELRHSSWFTRANAESTLTFLASLGAGFCCVDMPQGHEDSVPPILLATTDLAMVRMHGHSELWATGDKRERFTYAYSEEELVSWAERLRGLSGEAEQLHVLLNNCCAGQAQRDAARLAQLVGLRPEQA